MQDKVHERRRAESEGSSLHTSDYLRKSLTVDTLSDLETELQALGPYRRQDNPHHSSLIVHNLVNAHNAGSGCGGRPDGWGGRQRQRRKRLGHRAACRNAGQKIPLTPGVGPDEQTLIKEPVDRVIGKLTRALTTKPLGRIAQTSTGAVTTLWRAATQVMKPRD